MPWGLPDSQEGVCHFCEADVRSAHLGRQLRSLHTGSALGEQDGGLIGAEEKVINSKKKVDENMVSRFSLLRVRVNFENDQTLPRWTPTCPWGSTGRAPTAPAVVLCSSVSTYETEQFFQQ